MKSLAFPTIATLAMGLMVIGTTVASAQEAAVTYTNGAGDFLWNTTSTDWANGANSTAGTPTTFTNLDTAYFTASTSGTITVDPGTTSAPGIEVSNSSNSNGMLGGTDTNKIALDVTGGNYIFNGGTLTFTGDASTYHENDQYLDVAANASATFNNQLYDNVGSFYLEQAGGTGSITSNGGIQVGSVSSNGSGSGQLYIGNFNAGTVNFTGGTVRSAFTNETIGTTNVTGNTAFYTGQLNLYSGTSAGEGFFVNSSSASINSFATQYNTIEVGQGNNPGLLDVKAGTVNASGGLVVMLENNLTANAANTGTLLVEGGTVNTDTAGTGTPYGITLAPTAEASTGGIGKAVFTVTSGTVTTAGITFGGVETAGGVYNASAATSATVNISGGTTYIGTLGINQAAVAPATNTINLSGGIIGATANWSSTMAMILTTGANGNVTFQNANALTAAENITLNGVLSGTGGLNVAGAGTLTLAASNTYSGTTDVLSGATLSLALNTALASNSDLTLDMPSSVVNLDYTGYDYINQLTLDGTTYTSGIFSASQLNGGTGGGFLDIGNTAVPEPGTWALLLGGLGILLFVQRARRKA